MELNELDRLLISELGRGLPIVPRPYAAVAAKLGVDEQTVTEAIGRLTDAGVVTRFGIIVRHHELGYTHNGMVVWNIPDDEVHACAAVMSARDEVTLCYRRPRRLPDWPYNLFCMIHGRCRDEVHADAAAIAADIGMTRDDYDVLFSTRRFKQKGACYRPQQLERGAA